jgi:hypothetical protein
MFGIRGYQRQMPYMKEEQQQFMALLGQAPVRLTVEQAAWLLGCQPHDIPILVGSRLLKPLGNPPANGIKYFSTAELLESTRDRSWLAKLTNTICQHWQKKNARKKDHPSADDAQGGLLVKLSAAR